MSYNPFQTGNDLFYQYTAYKSEEPKESKDLIVGDDLFGEFKIPGAYSYNPVTGNIIAPANTPEVKEYDWSEMNKLGETHAEINNNFTHLNSPSKDRVLQAVEFFKSKGLSYNQSMGIVGNLMHESGDKTLNNITNIGDNGTSFGMAQWHDSKDSKRWTALKNYAKSIGKSESDFDTQLNFVWKELSENSKWLSNLKSTKTIEEATNQFMIDFENPKRSTANLRARINNALSLKRYYG